MLTLHCIPSTSNKQRDESFWAGDQNRSILELFEEIGYPQVDLRGTDESIVILLCMLTVDKE